MRRPLLSIFINLKDRPAAAALDRKIIVAFFVVLFCVASQAQGVRELPSPAGEGSGQSNLTSGRDGRVYLSWVERLGQGRFALRFATKEKSGWSAARTIAEGDKWFINWADFPSLAVLPDGSLAAHWLVRSGGNSPYAYDVHIARSFDGGKTWGESVRPHLDGTPTEHGFVSMFAAHGGSLGAVWLDGREMKQTAPHDAGGASHGGDGHGHGQMTLRYASLRRVGRALKIENEAQLDARVCECCQTSAAVTSEGPVVVYRDRSDTEVRDISIVRLRAGKWTTPATVHADKWKIDACPVNGPSVAALGRRVAVVWFTMGEDERARVRLAFSQDAGATFGRALEVSDGDPVGRTDVLLLDDGSAVVSWIEKTVRGAEVRARRVHADGRRGQTITVAPSGAARSSGFPQMIRSGDLIVFSWTGTTRVLTAELPAPAR